MVVSSSPYEHMIGKPDVKYVANMHGNEAVGREMMLHLIHYRRNPPFVNYLVTSYDSDQYIRWLLDNTRIHILPSMNPDGFEVAREGTCDGGQGRYNARGFDLNRNFPDYFKQNNKRSQPETEAVKEWVSKIQFVLSGGLHGGALVASYPFDNTPNTSFQSYSASPSLTPDDDVFKHLALTYSTNHNKMHRGAPCKPGTPSFNQGITNGAAWYPLTGKYSFYIAYVLINNNSACYEKYFVIKRSPLQCYSNTILTQPVQHFCHAGCVYIHHLFACATHNSTVARIVANLTGEKNEVTYVSKKILLANVYTLFFNEFDFFLQYHIKITARHE
ncbi:hypothetical protein B566_EDAN015165 [Ephemera danica]|nr:hypothetical protein B566_EDAN015165 [Ephemera danica]